MTINAAFRREVEIGRLCRDPLSYGSWVSLERPIIASSLVIHVIGS